MTYAQTIEFLFSKLPMFSRTGPAALKPGLDNTIALCAALGNPEKKFKSIHVAGTNGKGSVSHMLAAVFQANGYKTGLYTSPHLYDFRERIRINGNMISEEKVVAFTEAMLPQIELLQPSFFELTVALAFDHFAKEAIDIAIIEVGLGGRLDSTNVIVPEISVITNIGFDHMNLLGNTLEQIASEKAGIIKEGVPVVVGEKKQETDPVFRQKATAHNAALFFAPEHFSIPTYHLLPGELQLELLIKDEERTLPLRLDLPGLYQIQNIQTVWMALELLQQQGWKLDESKTVNALSQVKNLTGLWGRWDLLQAKPMLVLDVAHNKDGMAQMLQHSQKLQYKKLHLVIGMVQDKETASILKQLPKEAAYYFTQAHIPRALPVAELQAAATQAGLAGACFPDVNQALEKAMESATADDLVLVCGSVFLVAEVDRRRWQQKLPDPLGT